MARSKTGAKKKSGRSAREAAGLGREPRGLLVAPWWRGPLGKGVGVVALMLGGSAAVAWGLIVGHGALEARASSHLERARVSVAVDWPTARGASGESGAPTSWLSSYFQERLTSAAVAAAASEGASMSGGQLRAVSRVLHESGWFRDEPRVSREADGALRVVGRWRVPLAVVRHGGREHLIADDGGVLPVSAYATGESGRVFISGVANGPPMNAGGGIDVFRAWPGSGVPAAMALLRALPGDAVWRGQVAGIDVSGLEGGRGGDGLVIVTTYGTRVVWGASPSGFRPGETSTEGKLSRLQRFYEQYGRIDAGASRIEIFPQGPVVVEPGRS
ncbi:MAG: hypothetical protein EA378_08715 [Phycisphaerales bacterium]|nr:MAG: hypothetical protein EA378_08715 [Phycisphaerales bacterium]